MSGRASLGKLGAVLGVASIPALVAPSVIGRAAALIDHIPAGGEFAAAGHVGLVYALVPLVALSATVLVLAPGLLLALRLGRARTVAEWIFLGFVCSLVVVSVASAIAQASLGSMLRGSTYAAVLLVLAAAAFVLCWTGPAEHRAVPLAHREERRILFGLMMLWVTAHFVLTPKLLWDSFNGDGAHAFESSRLLLRHALPFWPADAGPVAGFPGMTSMLYAFPNAWFLRLFGEVEYAARFPFVLYLPVLVCGVTWLGHAGRGAAAPATPSRAFSGLALSVGAFALALAYSASYNPYSADIALPATQDTLLMIVYLGALAASVRREWGWLALFVALTYCSLPSGLILTGFWLVARALVERPVPWRDLFAMGALLVVAMVIAALMPRVLESLGASPPGGEYGVLGILRYFAFLQFTDLTRLLYVAIPAGLYPLFSCVAWRGQDRVGRALVLVTITYFCFFFFQAHVALHHFVPAMVLPMVVAYRQVTWSTAGSTLGRWWMALGVVALVLAFPWGRFAIHRQGRDVGQALAVRLPGYAESAAAVMRASTLLDRIFPYDWDASVPGVYGGSPLVWNHYARHQQTDAPQTNYIVQPTADPPPQGWRLAGRDSTGASLYVRSEDLLRVHRSLRPPTPPGSPLLAVPRGILFHSVPLKDGPRIVDVAATLAGWGLDVEPLLRRLGARRGS